jgi:DNA-binding SARP family transcriptional activator
MEFRILGPFEIRSDDGELLPVPRRRERELLSVLLLFAGLPEARELLARALWGDSQPADPEAALRVCACRARKMPGVADCLTVLPAGYRADPGAARIDVIRFRGARMQAERQSALGDLPGAAASLKDALGCWRDPPLPDLPAVPETGAEAARLLEQRRLAELDLADIMLALGQHKQIVADLHARVVADPLCERCWWQLMLALYRCGRRSEALAAYSRARAALVSEFGTGPGAEMRALLSQILKDVPPAAVGAGHGDEHRILADR